MGLHTCVVHPPEGPWCKAIPVWLGAQSVDVDTLVVADADCWADGLPAAIEAVEKGARWAIPHRTVHRLTEAATRQVLEGEAPDRLPLEQAAYKGLEGGGITVINREAFLEAPLDPRFKNWGQEDHSWALALFRLYGPAWRGAHPLWHCWHPHPARLSRKRGSLEGWQLFRRYCTARRTRADMEALIGEARVALEALEPELHHREALHSAG